jgi:hypothetical protein
MKKLVKYYSLFFLSALLGSCDLELQKDVEYEYHVLDPKVNMTAWEYMNSPRPDTIFNLMIKGLAYAGIDQSEYEAQGRTFLFLSNNAIYRITSGKLDANCVWARMKVKATGKAATKWQDYTPEEVRDLFHYHIIVDGAWTYDNLTPNNLQTTTMLQSDNNALFLKVMNDRNSKIRINDVLNSPKIFDVASSNIQTTNGVVHVLNLYAEPLK